MASGVSIYGPLRTNCRFELRIEPAIDWNDFRPEYDLEVL